MLIVWNLTALIASFIMVINGSDFGNVELKACMLKEEGMGEALPLTHKKVEAVRLSQRSLDGEISIDVCASEHLMKMTLPLQTGLKTDATLCMEQITGESDSRTCFGLSALKTTKSNSTVICWFQQNVTEKTFVILYLRTHSDTNEGPQHYTYRGRTELHNRGMCMPSVCDKIEPFYADMFHCGGKALMKIPNNATIFVMTLTCAFCEDQMDEEILFETSKNDSTNAAIEFGSNLQHLKYNLTVWFNIKDEFGEDKLCGYVKTVTIFCLGGSTSIPSTKEANNANIGQSKDSNDTCDTNFSHCSFLDFVLFGGSVSAVIIVMICFAAFIFVKRKKIARTLRSACSGETDAVSTGGEHIPMFLNNRSAGDSPVSTHFPKHAHFHKTDEHYRLLFLPRPFDSFTRDCMDSLSKILSLDGRIPSSCVFDKSIQNEIFANKFQWIDKILGDRHNIVIFLCFTSPSVKHEQSIVDEVMERCQSPATPPTCRAFFAHMTDSAEYLDESTFSGRRFNLMNVKEFEHFLEAVFIFYGYKADNEHDKQKFKQILHCGVSNHFMKKLRASC